MLLIVHLCKFGFVVVFERNIKRIIFYSLMKPHINEKGEKEMDLVAPSAALQISGRAGRYASEFVEGEVTCFKNNDLPILKKLLNTPVELVQVSIRKFVSTICMIIFGIAAVLNIEYTNSQLLLTISCILQNLFW